MAGRRSVLRSIPCEDGTPIGRTFSEELNDQYYVYFSPDGRELWVFPHMRHEMFRFDLP